jgi:hypothetical protein
MVAILKKITMKYIIIVVSMAFSSLSAQNLPKDTITVKPAFTGKYYSPPSGGEYEIWKDEDGLYFIVEERKLYIK